jgi:rhamnosyltransferase
MNVCAIIVTYHPQLDQLEQSLASLRPQVDALLLVDNASPELLLQGLRRLAREYVCLLHENSSNLGIATALNQGVEKARELGARFVVLFDQDSMVSCDFVAEELATHSRNATERKIGVVSPQIINRVTGVRSAAIRGGDGEPLLAQTSGSLMPVTVFDEAGPFRDDLFIDYVDYEYCLRMRLKGWHIAFAENASLNHLPGKNSVVSRFGRTKYIADASPTRHYYEVRNCIWIVIRYIRSFPAPSCRLLWMLGRERTKVLLYEKNRLLKAQAWIQGLSDAVRNSMGARKIWRAIWTSLGNGKVC